MVNTRISCIPSGVGLTDVLATLECCVRPSCFDDVASEKHHRCQKLRIWRGLDTQTQPQRTKHI